MTNSNQPVTQEKLKVGQEVLVRGKIVATNHRTDPPWVTVETEDKSFFAVDPQFAQPIEVKGKQGGTLEFTLAQAKALFDFFGGDETLVSVTRHEGKLLAYASEYPDEGSIDLGQPAGAKGQWQMSNAYEEAKLSLQSKDRESAPAVEERHRKLAEQVWELFAGCRSDEAIKLLANFEREVRLEALEQAAKWPFVSQAPLP